ncbi:MAG TPA: response regulator transcription factor [Ramlibacter sp.]|uniref:response regulator transcription factor n=1 Tax=Ramlibacter sp. TaxID=1917967 RepID=UPI002ED4E5F8
MRAAVRTTVIVVEDNPLHAQRYRENLARDPSLVLAGEFASAADAIQAAGALAPDVALIDLGLPDGSGFDVIRHIRQASPHTAIMVVSVFGGERNLFEAIEAGATGYLLKDSLPEDFNASIHALQAGESPISPALARLLLVRLRPGAAAPAPAPAPTAVPAPEAALSGDAAVPSPLSPRETTILEAIARGRSVLEIGESLHISPLTVKSHVQKIYRKLEATSRQHAVYLAHQRGILKL